MIRTLLNAVTATKTSDPDNTAAREANSTVQATVVGTGAVTATVIFDGSNDLLGWITLATIGLSGTTTATDGAPIFAKWGYIRARLTAISGTGAAVTATMAA